MAKTKILIVDDDALMLELCHDILESLGFAPVTHQDSNTAIDMIASERPDLVITDLKMPGIDGIEVLKYSKAAYPDLPVIILTGQGSIESAFEAVQQGADDYVTKPFQARELNLRIHQVLQKADMTKENLKLRKALKKSSSSSKIIGGSRPMKSVQALIERAAPTQANIMISGESGTGKELTARSVHTLSERSDKPFVAVDCVSLPDQLFESELFGHMKGSFTGASSDKEGLFETANGGTLFLDEITEMNIDLQGKLLRVLQERKFRRVGGRDLHDLNVRLIAATNRNPAQAVKEERLRLDLYYRLNVIPIELPPLRHRDGDIIELLHHFLSRFSKLNGLPLKMLSQEVLDVLVSYRWPGNIRELQNLAERLVILSTGQTILLKDLPAEILGDRGPGNADTANNQAASSSPLTSTSGSSFGLLTEFCKQPMKDAKQLFLKYYIEQLVDRYDGRITEAAKQSGINRRTIHRILAENDIDPKNFRDGTTHQL